MADKKKDKPKIKAKATKPNEAKIPAGEEIKESEIGVLFIDESKSQIGFIKFDSSGMLIYQMIKKGMHVFAFKSLEPIMTQAIKEPLYKKYAELLKVNSKLPDKILEQEVKSCADFLNAMEGPLKLGSYTVRALMINIGPQ
jgi:hypothetical protein